MQELAHGVLTWPAGDRRSDRYGNVYLIGQDYGATVTVEPRQNDALMASLDGKRVRLICEVVETRTSGHIGDFFHGFFPSTPDVGERIDLGVGTLVIGMDTSEEGDKTIALRPDDGRQVFWFDPRKLYRLHDQTVTVFVEETTDPCHPAPFREEQTP